MKEIIETMPRIELALIIIGVFVLILGIILGYAMIHEYRMYLENHWKARYSFRDFIKRERFYIFLLFASIFILLTNLLYFLEWVSARMDELALWWILVLLLEIDLYFYGKKNEWYDKLFDNKKSVAGCNTCIYSSIFFCESRSKKRWKDYFARDRKSVGRERVC